VLIPFQHRQFRAVQVLGNLPQPRIVFVVVMDSGLRGSDVGTSEFLSGLPTSRVSSPRYGAD
jgi:hypothetical protein